MNSHPRTDLDESPFSALQPHGIVCGTDFSDASAQAAEVAAALAKRLADPFVLVHAVNDGARESLPETLRDSLALYARAQFHEQRERVRSMGVKLIEAFDTGAPPAVLLHQAAVHRARLVVMAASSKRRHRPRLHGGVAEQVAEAAETPSLIVRNSEPLLRWMKGERRLRILVGADFSPPSEAALQWIHEMRRIAPCDVTVVYLDHDLSAYLGRDLNAATLMDEFVLGMARKEEVTFRRRVRQLLGTSHVRVHFESGWGYSDAHLIQLAEQERADLLVVGTHSRHGFSRMGHHSVSRGILRYAPLNVACVPATTVQRHAARPLLLSPFKQRRLAD